MVAAMDWKWLSLISAISFLFWKLIIQKLKRLPPGPIKLPILGNLLSLGKHHPHLDLYHLSKKYGPIMHLQLGCISTVVVSSASAAEKFLKTYDSIFADRPYNTAAWYASYEQKNLIFAKYGSYWRNMRKICTLQLLSNLRINQFQPTRRKELGLLVQLLRSNGGGVVDFSGLVANLMADMTCLMIFGKKYLDNKLVDDDFSKRFKDVVQELGHIAAVPNLGEFFPFLNFLDLQGHISRLKVLGKAFDEFLERIFDEHLEIRTVQKDENQTRDFVDTMIDILESGNNDFEFHRQHAKSIVMVSNI